MASKSINITRRKKHLYSGFSTKKNNFPLFKVKCKGDKYKDKTIYIHEDKESNDGITDELILEDANFEIVPPYPHIERTCIFISGASGCGKSHWAAGYCKQYKKRFPKNNIVLICPKPEDPVLDKLNIMRIQINEENFANEETKVSIEEFRNSLVVFDDCEGLNRKIRTYVDDFKEKILTLGRSYKISCIVINHLSCNRSETQKAITESQMLVIFPRSNSMKAQYRRLLGNYCGFDKNEINKVFKLPSRSVCIYRDYPGPIVIARDEAYFL